MTVDRMFIRRDGWLTSQIDDDLIMMNAEHEYYLNLSGSGGRIWELLETPCSLTDLCHVLAGEYDITPDAARPEVSAFLEHMLQQKAIDVAS
ncbi:MAG: PqqD family protein [Deltaproteobacteria bacterium]|nr:PqqD family protein [Deltaproteobacteria bacterium]